MSQETIEMRSSFGRHFLIYKLLLICLIVAGQQSTTGQALWLFQDIANSNKTTLSSMASLLEHLPTGSTEATVQVIEQTKETATAQQQQQQILQQAMSPFSIAGIRPASIASLLNTVSDTGFSYFNVHDQCRSRTACDVGFMLYKRVNFIHNWVIRASVRSLVDHTNAYSIAWNNGMLGKNCTLVYPACSQSPLESLMNFAFLTS